MAKHRNVLPDNTSWHEATKRYMARKMFQGVRYTAYHLTSPTAALKDVDAQIDEVRRKGKPSLTTIGDIGLEWLEDRKKDLATNRIKFNTYRNAECIYNKYIKPIASTKVQSFDVQEWIDDLNGNPNYIRKIWEAMEHILKMARKKDIIRFVPDDIKLPKPKNEAKQMKDQSDIDKIIEAAANTRYYDVVLFSLNTGLRKEDTLPLKWTDFDFRENTVSLQRFYVRCENGWKVSDEGKTHKSIRKVPVFPWLVKHISDMPRKGEYVFLGMHGGILSPNTLHGAWKRILKAAGVEMKWHGLRHQFASVLRDAGVPLDIIRDLLGHTKISMTEQYSHLRFEMSQKAIESIGVKHGVNKKVDPPTEA